ncbi:universal stress protein [Halobellus rufus]|uniref:universal stress protein n=1 Tax=Halobellus rufus TaxID=1448860 RepID=UPI0006791477|nr:universal stress protein [Halobellus rufus]
MVIIAAVDRSDRAKHVVTEAGMLAEAFDEPLHIIHVLSKNEFLEIEATSLEKKNRPVDMDRIQQFAAEHANEAAEDIEIAYEAIGRVGDAQTEVNQYAEDLDARYIVVGGQRRSPTGKALFGSVTQSILLNADRPVLTVIA